jgi:hypothetical protein
MVFQTYCCEAGAGGGTTVMLLKNKYLETLADLSDELLILFVILAAIISAIGVTLRDEIRELRKDRS